MNILFATSEAVPFAKTGGLADVCGALPVELERLGHRAAVILPAYRSTRQSGLPIERLDIELAIPIGSKTVAGSILRSHLPDSDVPVYLIEQDSYFDRPTLYGEGGGEYKDNCERFVFYCRAVLEAMRLLELRVDVLHAHDWTTGLLPAYLKTELRGVPPYELTASVFTIHNLAYQGTFWHWDMLLTGMDWKYFNWRQMEFYGNLNLMKTGLVFAEALTTVSPRYAEEIQSAPLGCGLEGVLQHRRSVLTGIVNGIDYSLWNPATDEHLPVQYDLSTVGKGKPACKAALQAELGLPQMPGALLIGLVGRLCDQKGFDIAEAVITQWVRSFDAQWVVLGTGDAKYHDLFAKLAERYPQRVAVRLAFSDPLAHRIEGGADIFAMPSLYEPCGLSQLYSLKYGTVPVVRLTGGLADTITNVSDETLAAGTATGFGFHDYSALALSEALQRACDLYRGRPETWRQLMQNGMRQDWSWRRSARQYVDLYEQTVARVKQPMAVAR